MKNWIVMGVVFFGIAGSLFFGAFALLFAHVEYVDTSLPGNPVVREYIYRMPHPLPLFFLTGGIASLIAGTACLIGYMDNRKKQGN